MSDFQQGRDWFRASDGKWYPPTRESQQHPVYRQPRQPRITSQDMAYGTVGGCLIGIMLLVGGLAALMLLGYALKP